MSDAVVGLVGVLIGVLGTLMVQYYVVRQKARELFLTSLDHLGGKSQERNLGISALEFYWDEYASEQRLIVPLLVGAAIYLLTESEQGKAQHERYNLRRIMHLLLVKYKIDPSVTTDPSLIACYRDLHRALAARIQRRSQRRVNRSLLCADLRSKATSSPNGRRSWKQNSRN